MFLIFPQITKTRNIMKDDNGCPCGQYVAMYVDKDLNLNIYTNRGCPTKKNHFKPPPKQKGTLLLAITITTDDMNRHVNMFPGVFYLNVTANTNKQKRDLFLMVVKYANGKAYIGNVTIIPCEKRWVYTHIYKIFLLDLFGKVTISRNRLCLTDDNIAEWGPLDDCINTMGCWGQSRHMLCMFHALTMQYFEKIYKKLPGRGKGAGRKLSDVGKAYGEKKKLC
jgi:hypothetical protein